MVNVGRGIFGFVALFFISTGLMFLFLPANALGHMMVGGTADAAALSSIRGLWGGAIFAIGVSVLIGAIKQDFAHIRVGAIFVLSIIAGRIIGYFMDGSFPEFAKMISPPIGVFILMLIAHKLMASKSHS